MPNVDCAEQLLDSDQFCLLVGEGQFDSQLKFSGIFELRSDNKSVIIYDMIAYLDEPEDLNPSHSCCLKYSRSYAKIGYQYHDPDVIIVSAILILFLKNLFLVKLTLVNKDLSASIL